MKRREGGREREREGRRGEGGCVGSEMAKANSKL